MSSKDRVKEAYKHVFSTEDGKLMWGDMCKAHHMHSSTFVETPGPHDPLELARREGERNVLLRIMAICQEPFNVEGENNG